MHAYQLSTLKIIATLLLFFMLVGVNCCQSLTVDETKRLGDMITIALNKFRKAKHELPKDIQMLVPEYLTEIPKVKHRFFYIGPDENFEYHFHVTPYEGWFAVRFMDKTGHTYEYHSKADSKEDYHLFANNPELISEDITDDDIYALRKASLPSNCRAD